MTTNQQKLVISENTNNVAPSFYKSLSGNPTYDRLQLYATRANIPYISEIITDSVKLDSNGIITKLILFKEKYNSVPLVEGFGIHPLYYNYTEVTYGGEPLRKFLPKTEYVTKFPYEDISYSDDGSSAFAFPLYIGFGVIDTTSVQLIINTSCFNDGTNFTFPYANQIYKYKLRVWNLNLKNDRK